MNKAAQELGSDTVGKPENPQNLVRKKKGENTLIVFYCFAPSTTIPLILWELVHPDWPRLTGGFNFVLQMWHLDGVLHDERAHPGGGGGGFSR